MFPIQDTVPSRSVPLVTWGNLLLFPTARIVTLFILVVFPVFVEIPAVVFLGIWFVSQLFSGTLSLVSPSSYEGVAWWAHVGGFVAGMVLLPVFRKSRTQYRR